MRWVWWIVGIGAFLAMLYSCALPGELAVGRLDDREGLTGTYTVNGIDPTGVEYSGTLIILDAADAVDRATDRADDGTADAGIPDDALRLEWIVTGAVHEGIGVVAGDELTVEWRTVSSGAGGGEGTATYRIRADGSLVGTRHIDGVDTAATEEIFPEP